MELAEKKSIISSFIYREPDTWDPPVRPYIGASSRNVAKFKTGRREREKFQHANLSSNEMLTCGTKLHNQRADSPSNAIKLTQRHNREQKIHHTHVYSNNRM